MVIDVLGPTTTLPSGRLELDVALDTGGVESLLYHFTVETDPAQLALVDMIETPPAGLYGYSSSVLGAFTVYGLKCDDPVAVDQVVIALVFHVIDTPPSTVVSITPLLDDYGIWDVIRDENQMLVPAEHITLNGWQVHVPELDLTPFLVH